MPVATRRFLVVLVAVVVATAGVVVSQRATAASSTPVVFVATGENFPDALGAGPAAAHPVQTDHIRLGVSLCDDQGGVARPGRAVNVRLSR